MKKTTKFANKYIEYFKYGYIFVELFTSYSSLSQSPR